MRLPIVITFKILQYTFYARKTFLPTMVFNEIRL